MIEIKVIDEKSKQDILLPNQPFPLIGYLRPTYNKEGWSYTIQKNTQIDWQTFPDENYDYDDMKKDCYFIGAYHNQHCIGLAILQTGAFNHLYLYDLKVNQTYRKQGIASLLLEKCKELALKEHYRGIWTIGQDNNLIACLFYLKEGFEIGGLDTHCYKGTKQEGKSDIHFYLEI